MYKLKNFIKIILLSTIILAGCSSKRINTSQQYQYKSVGYTIQVGAFNNLNNALRLIDILDKKGLDPFLFKEDNKYKVRFGSFSSVKGARNQAYQLQKQSTIEDFFIVAPYDYPIFNDKNYNKSSKKLRNSLTKTAYKYIGVPYVWGGTSSSGFDCSGLTRAIYRLNGISIPRVSQDQFASGRYVKKSKLKNGDLVFFATGKKKIVSHVGIYVGNGKFIHSPRRGSKVKVDNLHSKYWNKRYMGGKSYVQY